MHKERLLKNNIETIPKENAPSRWNMIGELTLLDDWVESNFLRILWEYSLESTVVAFEGLFEASTLNSSYNSNGKEFYLRKSQKPQEDTGSIVVKKQTWSGAHLMLPGIQENFLKKSLNTIAIQEMASVTRSERWSENEI